MAIAWQVFLGLALFAVVACVLIVVRRVQLATWARVRPNLGRFLLTVCIALVACAAAVGLGYAVGWATS